MNWRMSSCFILVSISFRLLDMSVDIADVDADGRKKLIAALDAKSKIPASLKRLLPHQDCSEEKGGQVRVLGKRKHPS